MFQYDVIHNLTNKARIHEKVLNGVETYPWETNIDLSYTYGGPRPHAPTQVGDTNISYDASGNITQLHNTQTGELKDLIGDDDGRMIQSETQLGIVRNYYDGRGLRVLKRSENGGDTVFVNSYFDLKLVEGNDPLGTKHIYADGMRVCSTFEGEYDLNSTGNIPPQDAGKSYYFLGDHLGSSNLLTRDDGTVHEHYEYFPDGEIWIEQKPNIEIENGYLFTGKFLDEETGLYDFGQRFYDPKTGIWLSTDPLFSDTPGEAIGRPMVMSLYAYGAQNPIRFIDPDGRDVEGGPNSFYAPDYKNSPYYMPDIGGGNGGKGVFFVLRTGIGFVPLVGELADFIELAYDLYQKDYTAASLSATGLLIPFAATSVLKKGQKLGSNMLEEGAGLEAYPPNIRSSISNYKEGTSQIVPQIRDDACGAVCARTILRDRGIKRLLNNYVTKRYRIKLSFTRKIRRAR